MHPHFPHVIIAFPLPSIKYMYIVCVACIKIRKRREARDHTIHFCMYMYIIITMHLLYMYAGPPDPPRVSVDIRPGELVFYWQPNVPSCSLIEYHIICNNNCGTCILNGTTASCSNLTLSTVASICSLCVSSMACGFSQATSNPTNVTFKGMSSTQSCDDPLYLVNDCSFHTVPGNPMVQTLVPVYTYKSDMQSLTGIIITISQEVS